MEQISMIFRSLITLSDVIGDIPDGEIRRMTQLDDDEEHALLASSSGDVVQVQMPDVMAHSVRRALESDNASLELDVRSLPLLVKLSGMPAERVFPLLSFRYVDNRWRFARQTGAHVRPVRIGPVSEFKLCCPICKTLLASSACSNHGVLFAWAGIQLPVCAGCSKMSRDVSAMAPGACFACMRRTTQRAYRRSDTNVVLLLCDECIESDWPAVMETAGILLKSVTLNTDRAYSQVELVVECTVQALARRFVAKKRDADADSPEPAAKSARPDCCAVSAARCCATGCSASICRACLVERHGQLAAGIYSGARALWRCPDHFTTLPSS